MLSLRTLVVAAVAFMAVGASAMPIKSHHAHHAVAQQEMTEAQYQTSFVSYVKEFNKTYPSDEFFARFNIFKANHAKVAAHQLEAAQGKHTYTLAVNEFADMTAAEFKAKYLGFQARQYETLRAANSEGPHDDVTAPAAALDWRDKNAVTPVKDQQACGSCWAFSTTGSTEGAHAIKTGQLVSLSEQQLVDCSTAQGNNGCNGGLMDQGFEYIIANKGVTTEDSYPYTAAQGTCAASGKSTAATLSSFVDVKTGDEGDLLKAVNVGPVSIAVDAGEFQLYGGGILSDSTCGTALDHGVLLVGYGSEAGQDYWIVKNSWNASWGEKGYIRLIRGKNECGLANMASYPVV